MEVEFAMKNLAIYVHIPFCKQKCKYCDFVSFTNSKFSVEGYVQQLCREIVSYKEQANNYVVTSVYFGGGTPSFIDAKYIEIIFNTIKRNYNFPENMENTIEVNPGTANEEAFKKYKEIGFNRISFGFQTAQDEILKNIGRIHTWEEAYNGFYMARVAGFNNISLDLMFGLPSQKLADVRETLDKFIKLNPEHISTYSLKVEDRTVFGKMKKEGKLKLPEENEEREMYYLVKNTLKDNGYVHYEISNFAKPGFEAKHNCAYWERQDYLGFGLAASSCFNETRFSNTENFNEYLNNPIRNFREEEVLTEDVIASERVILGLRMLKGIDVKLINNEEWKKSVEKLKKEELLLEKENRVYLTDKGLDLANQVFVEFI